MTLLLILLSHFSHVKQLLSVTIIKVNADVQHSSNLEHLKSYLLYLVSIFVLSVVLIAHYCIVSNFCPLNFLFWLIASFSVVVKHLNKLSELTCRLYRSVCIWILKWKRGTISDGWRSHWFSFHQYNLTYVVYRISMYFFQLCVKD
jgi:hypothetical protein